MMSTNVKKKKLLRKNSTKSPLRMRMRNVWRIHRVGEGRGAGGMLMVGSGAGQHRTRTGAGY